MLQRQGPAPDLLDTLERAVRAQRKALIAGRIDELAEAGDSLTIALSALAGLRGLALTAAQSGRLRRLRALISANGELLARNTSADQRRLEALVGPRPTYGAGATSGSGASGSRRLGTA